MHHQNPHPVSEREVLERAAQIAGKTLQHLARLHGLSVPAQLARAKGWTVRMIEISLGATASSRPEPDFQAIDVELKTIPVGGDGKARESTYVCTVPLTPEPDITWETSLVKRKLSRVLWIPVEDEPSIALAERRIGTAILWCPDRQQENILRHDWEELMNMI